MCFICRLLLAVLLARFVGRLLLWGMGLALLVALIAPARAVFLALGDVLTTLGMVGPPLTVLVIALICVGLAIVVRRRS
ncbi:hypothetical protein [Streptomyces qinglanensis]|uniref:hypothetical protein n=1 Tax=Streptomyces qinglanensis TaxID=943816 RepID=UPI003D745F06